MSFFDDVEHEARHDYDPEPYWNRPEPGEIQEMEDESRRWWKAHYERVAREQYAPWIQKRGKK